MDPCLRPRTSLQRCVANAFGLWFFVCVQASVYSPSLSIPSTKASLYRQRTILANERKWKVIHAHSPDGGYLAVAVSKMIIKMLRHYDQDERQTDGSRHWDTIRPVLLRAFAQQGARDFDEGFWLHLIHEGSNKKRLECCKDNNGSLCYLRAIQGHSGGIPISPELMNHTLIPYKWKEYIFHRGISWNFRSILESGIIPRGKENDRAQQAVFFTPLNRKRPR